MAKRVTAAEMLQAGRNHPPKESLPEQPIIPAADLLAAPTSSSSTAPESYENSSRRLVDQTPKPLDVSVPSQLVDRVTRSLVAPTTGVLVNSASDPLVAESTSSLNGQSGSRHDGSWQVPEGETGGSGGTGLLGDQTELVDNNSTSVTSSALHPEQAVADQRSEPRTGLVSNAPTSSGSDVQSTSYLVTEATKQLVVNPPPTYQRVTVFLTPRQRQWLKITGRHLPVEGLSVSDIVRLAVNRLSADVEAGLPLVHELTAQAHGEAQTMAGRRNRGLPPIGG